ncbi:MAG TPA: aspartate aminotransferase family protein, partial [Phnomibacter sp.]|nr:aspartate aminotransferase family protein [Phnomibacter sp.]
LVYQADEEHDALLKAAVNEMFSENYLNPLAFKSLHRMEREVVRMTASMLHGDENAVGVMTSGGTESILLAMLAYRQYARKMQPNISRPEIVLPSTAHPAFDKAAFYFGLQLKKVPVTIELAADTEAMEKMINGNTILLVASAPSYPHGILDPIEKLSAIALKHKLPLHIDSCIGGFMLPWLEKLGHPIPRWDFRVPGVTSISADVHKFGFGPKGTSVITYRSMDHLRHQFTVTTDFPGGIYLSPTLLGTRPGSNIAAAWASLMHLGEAGYMRIANQLMEATEKLKQGLLAIDGIRIMGAPVMNLVAFGTDNNAPDIYVVADQLEEKGWMVDRQQFPVCIHLTVLPTNMALIEEYLTDLLQAMNYARKHRGAVAKGNAAVYGMMARVTFRGMVEHSVRKMMEDLFGGGLPQQSSPKEKKERTVMRSPWWMGWMNRILRKWEQLRK